MKKTAKTSKPKTNSNANKKKAPAKASTRRGKIKIPPVTEIWD